MQEFDFLRVIYSYFWGEILNIYAIDGGLITSDSKTIASLSKYVFMMKIACPENNDSCF